jgi:hypothetical protein
MELEWELTKLSERLRGDLIQTYKILKNHDDISWVKIQEKIFLKVLMRRGKTLGMTLV